MDKLTKDAFLKEMRAYAGKAFNGYSYFTCDTEHDVYAIIDIAQLREQKIVQASLIIQLMDDFIMIHTDINDKPLVDALVQAGVPRDRIVLAYMGETLETSPKQMEMPSSPR